MSKKEEFFSNPGSKFEPVYTSFYDENGVLELEEVSQVNIYNKIQSYADECDMAVLIQRYMAGETDVFEKAKTFFADVSEMPKTYQDMLNMQIKAENFFNELPVTTKQKFNNSFSEFLCSIDDEDFLQKAGFLNLNTQANNIENVLDPKPDGGVIDE